MGLFDSIKGAVGSAIGAASASALPGIIENAYPGGLNGMLQQLQQSGYGKQVDSWLGRGPNEPITAQDLAGVLNNDQVKQVEEKLGIPANQVLETIAKHLPDAVDKHSPNGQLEPPPAA